MATRIPRDKSRLIDDDLKDWTRCKEDLKVPNPQPTEETILDKLLYICENTSELDLTNEYAQELYQEVAQLLHEKNAEIERMKEGLETVNTEAYKLLDVLRDLEYFKSKQEQPSQAERVRDLKESIGIKSTSGEDYFQCQ